MPLRRAPRRGRACSPGPGRRRPVATRPLPGCSRSAPARPPSTCTSTTAAASSTRVIAADCSSPTDATSYASTSPPRGRRPRSGLLETWSRASPTRRCRSSPASRPDSGSPPRSRPTTASPSARRRRRARSTRSPGPACPRASRPRAAWCRLRSTSRPEQRAGAAGCRAPPRAGSRRRRSTGRSRERPKPPPAEARRPRRQGRCVTSGARTASSCAAGTTPPAAPSRSAPVIPVSCRAGPSRPTAPCSRPPSWRRRATRWRRRPWSTASAATRARRAPPCAVGRSAARGWARPR